MLPEMLKLLAGPCPKCGTMLKGEHMLFAAWVKEDKHIMSCPSCNTQTPLDDLALPQTEKEVEHDGKEV